MRTLLTLEEKKARRSAVQKLYRKTNREKINAQRRARRATDPEYKERLTEYSKNYRASVATGYGRGRPRLEETRPVSVLAQTAMRYRKDNAKWKEYNRVKQAEWVAANPERRKEIRVASIARRKLRNQAAE
jgi:hypothetical protein